MGEAAYQRVKQQALRQPTQAWTNLDAKWFPLRAHSLRESLQNRALIQEMLSECSTQAWPLSPVRRFRFGF